MFALLVLQMVTATKKRREGAYPRKASASSGPTTNLKQSILRLSISMVGVPPLLSHVYIGEGNATTLATMLVTMTHLYLPWPPWAERHK
jgi:hypothetical protein